jgi:DNA-binding phage protein
MRSMPLTRDFKKTIAERAARDAEFRSELLREGIESMIAGDVATGRAILRDYINATVGFADVSEATNISPKSLMRMLGPNGNPRARNLFDIVAYLQRREDLRFRLERQKGGRRARALRA